MISRNTKVILSKMFNDVQKDFNCTNSTIVNLADNFRFIIWVSTVVSAAFGYYGLTMKLFLSLLVVGFLPKLGHFFSKTFSLFSHKFSVTSNVSFTEYQNILDSLRNFFNRNENLISEEGVWEPIFIRQLDFNEQLILFKMGADIEDIPLLWNTKNKIKNKEEKLLLDLNLDIDSLQWKSMKVLACSQRDGSLNVSSLLPVGTDLELGYIRAQKYAVKYQPAIQMINDIESSVEKLRQ